MEHQIAVLQCSVFLWCCLLISVIFYMINLLNKTMIVHSMSSTRKKTCYINLLSLVMQYHMTHYVSDALVRASTLLRQLLALTNAL